MAPGYRSTRFILAALEARGLQPAPPADKRTLIRRATFDLIGLPPTPEEIDAFLADDRPTPLPGSSTACSPRRNTASAGGGTGSTWLDTRTRTALDENVAHGNAWRYRDYVIARFNGDKPYDRFVLRADRRRPAAAGDATTGDRERLIATGFPRARAEGARRGRRDARWRWTSSTSRSTRSAGSFMGLTLGCARCHDHKFDPIPTADYYGLAGIFKSTRTMENFRKVVAKWHEQPLADERHGRARPTSTEAIAAKTRRSQVPIKAATERLESARGGVKVPKKPEPLCPRRRGGAKRLREELAELEKSRAGDSRQRWACRGAGSSTSHPHPRAAI